MNSAEEFDLGPSFDPLSLATAEQCLRAMDQADRETAGIAAQLNEAMSKFHAEGERGDRKWFISARTALKHRKRIRQRIQERLGQLNRDTRRAELAARNGRFEQAFIEAAKESLPAELYGRLSEAAHAAMARVRLERAA